jgi:exosortase/archaeosortase family protein
MENPLLGGRKLTARQERLYETLVFLVKLAILSLPVYVVVSSGLSLYPLQSAAASQSGQLLLSLGMEVSRSGAEMEVDGFRFFINEDCTGWKSMLFITALVLSAPAVAWSRRIVGVLVGIPVAWAANLLRIVSVVLAQKAGGVEAAMLFHDYVWQFLLVGIVLAVWLAWLLLLGRPDIGKGLAGKLI